jgi:hypothetical protein
MAQIMRIFTCIVIDPTDSYAYIGTKTGDIVEISLPTTSTKELVQPRSFSLRVSTPLDFSLTPTSFSVLVMEPLLKSAPQTCY